MPLNDARRIPLATYRLQLHAQFAFADAEKRLPYLRALGISDLYCSPIFRAAPGSTHGYDVADYRKINPELGGGEAFVRLTERLRENGMAVLLDFVPNHMGIQGPFNAWWRDVLECGPHSPYATYFDIHWGASREPGRPRVLVPILEEHYGAVLEAGKLSLSFQNGAFAIVYADIRFPVNPDTYPLILGKLVDDRGLTAGVRAALDQLVDAFGNLPFPDAVDDPARAQSRAQEIEHLKRRLGDLVAEAPELRASLERRIAQMNGEVGNPRSFDELDRLVDKQHYRLARWKAGVHEINYRRFFAVDSLIGLRMENAQVFHESHLLVRHLVREGRVAGLRIDHIDGLWDPQQYLERLQGLTLDDNGRGDGKPLYVLVEKIRERRETLPPEWKIHGTTGYEFIAQLSGLFVDPSNEARFTACYRVSTGDQTDYEQVVYEKKRLILEEMFANAVTTFGYGLADLVIGDRRWRDLTGHELITAVREVIACFDVYRTYRRDGAMEPTDRARVNAACDKAIARNPRFDPGPIEFLRSFLTGDYPGPDADPEYRERALRWVMTLQQYTGAVMAKSVEDTAYYTYCRFVALNDVGGDPAVFGESVEAFHQANLRRLETEPHALLATSTHDTKLSEDVRARLYTLSEIPAEWEDWVAEWRGIASVHKAKLDLLNAPDPVDEYRLYQILIGAWPLETNEPGEEFRKRIREHVRKAVNEAKRFTSWVHPNDAYLEACDRFVDALLTPSETNEFLRSFVPRAQRVAHLGIANSLSQVVLKATVPGVPDFYQGNELWDFSLVDPDNRRPVDYDAREKALSAVSSRLPVELLRGWTDGAIKLWTTQKLLALRQRCPELFQRGSYTPLSFSGRFQKHAVGFRRDLDGRSLVVVVPRLSALLGVPPTGLVWDDTALDTAGREGDWENVFDGRRFPGNAPLAMVDLFADLPFAVLVAGC